MRIHSPYPASWALAQRIGYLYSEGEIIYLADTPFERLLDIQRQVAQCLPAHIPRDLLPSEYCGREYSAPKGWRRAWCFYRSLSALSPG